MPVRWANEVQGLYKDIPGYIKELKSPMRDIYKTADMRKQDLLKTEVTNLSCFLLLREFRMELNTMPLRGTLQLSTCFLENQQ